MLPWQRHGVSYRYQKNNVFVVNLLAAIFGDRRIKGFREKGEYETQISKTVFSQLKTNQYRALHVTELVSSSLRSKERGCYCPGFFNASECPSVSVNRTPLSLNAAPLFDEKSTQIGLKSALFLYLSKC